MESPNTSRGDLPIRRRRQILALVVPLACLAAWGVCQVGLARGDDGPGGKGAPDARIEPRADQGATTWTTAVRPKPLTWRVKMGLDWLVSHQLPGGGWGDGDQMIQMLKG